MKKTELERMCELAEAFKTTPATGAEKLNNNPKVFREFTKLMAKVEAGKTGADQGYVLLIKVLTKVMSNKEAEKFLSEY